MLNARRKTGRAGLCAKSGGRCSVSAENIGRHGGHPSREQQGSIARRGAFTLVELLVVILIIGVLAMLLFPAFKGAVAAANTAKCAGNLRQMYVAAGAYASDNNGDVPPINNGGTEWYIQLAKMCSPASSDGAAMIQCRKMFACPCSPNARYTITQQNPPYSTNAYSWPGVCDYGQNVYAHNITSAAPGKRRADGSCYLAKFGTMKRPSQTPYIEDVVFASAFGEFTAPAATATNNTDAIPSANGPPLGTFSQRHNGGGNILWFDGHISYMKYNDYRTFCRTLANTKPTEMDQHAIFINMGESFSSWPGYW